MAGALCPFGTGFDDVVAGCAVVYVEPTAVYMGVMQPLLRQRVA